MFENTSPVASSLPNPDASNLLNVSILSPLTNAQRTRVSMMYQVRRQKLKECLNFLVENNPIYANVTMNYSYVPDTIVENNSTDDSFHFDENMSGSNEN
jgi:hypothetical protein